MANKKSASGARNKKSMLSNDSLSGFTIIEVVLVLAIAGLIFMMVFIALPQLQRAQRDTQRRTHLSAFQSAVTQYQANNNGKIPGQGEANDIKCTGDQAFGASAGGSGEAGESGGATGGSSKNVACRLIKVYLHGANATENTFVDPDGTPYDVTITHNTATADEFNHMIYFVTNSKCDGEEAVQASNPRDFAVLYKLEGSGTYCSDNQ